MEKKTYIAPELETTSISALLIISTSNMYTKDKDADSNLDMLSKERYYLIDSFDSEEDF